MSNSTIFAEDANRVDCEQLKISSIAFHNWGMILLKYTGDGINIYPPLNIDHIPREARSLVLIVDEPGAPIDTPAHCLVWNIPETLFNGVHEDQNIEAACDFCLQHNAGCGQSSDVHPYFFRVHALDTRVDLTPSAKKLQLEELINEHIIASGVLVGLS